MEKGRSYQRNSTTECSRVRDASVPIGRPSQLLIKITGKRSKYGHTIVEYQNTKDEKDVFGEEKIDHFDEKRPYILSAILGA